MSSSRVSLHDCSVSIRVPTPPSAPPDTSEQIALQALSGTRDQTEAYIGETIFVLLTLSHKEASASCDALQRAIANCDEPYVYMGSLPHTDSDEKASCRLPVMRHTRWLRATHHGCAVMCKGMWLLVRSPPQTAQPSRALPMAGRHKLVLCMREMSVPNMRNSSVWATIDRASRLFGKSVALYATRPILLSMPIDIRCECVTVSHSVEHALVNVSVRNSTGDAYLSVAPPYINVSSSRVVARHADVNSHGRSVALHARYEFVLLSGDDDSDDDSGVSSATAEHDAALSKQASSHCSCDDDDALFVPSLNHATTRHAATLAPREVYNFVFRALPNSSQPPWRADAATLRTHECIQTSVAVAWSCAPQQQHASAPLFAAQRACEQLHARGGGGGGGGGELTAHKRSSLALHVSSFNWRPSALLRSLLVSFGAPQRVTLGERVFVSMGVRNQTGRVLRRVQLRLQQRDDDEPHALLALRTVLWVGDLANGGETRLQVPCVALREGRVNFGAVRVADAHGTLWLTPRAFCTMVHA